MNLLLAILAGAIQGLTEFLPISSTGHLIIFENLFNISQESFGLAFDASLHLGTLLAVLIFFYKDYLKILNFKNNLLFKLIAGTIPAVVIGLFLESKVETVFRQTYVVAISLIVFSFVMIFAEKYAKQTKSKENISVFESLIIGFFQSLALIPGISRSGSTISAGLFLKLKREEAAKFAFMLSGPVIAGAGLKKLLEVSTENFNGQQMQYFIVGIITSFVFGYFTIKFLLKYLSSKGLYPFIIYRIVLGTILLISMVKL